MHSLRFTNEASSNGVVERDFMVGDVPGVLWSPAAGLEHAPLVLMGHGGGMHKKTPAQVARARDAVTQWGYNVAAIDAPGHGERPRTADDEQARLDLRQALTDGDHEGFKAVSIRFAISLAERAVPEWQATLDALQELPEIGSEAPIGYGGGISLGTAIGVPLTATDSRISAAIFGGGFFVYDEQLEAARRITVPIQFLLPWDDEHVDRQSGITLFDAFATQEKTLHANPGDHRTIRWIGLDNEFLPRHLGRPPAA
ncbi:alpha/beta hydrolase [Kribbella sp. NPDC050820]|uniref:alpha/beta hydrolase n=1 Tax=Kribbella sp. NPDC050820 TaxID=3155408 RepID=UPI0033D77F1F